MMAGQTKKEIDMSEKQRSALLHQMRKQANMKLCAALMRNEIEKARAIMWDYVNDPLRAELENAEAVGATPAQV